VNKFKKNIAEKSSLLSKNIKKPRYTEIMRHNQRNAQFSSPGRQLYMQYGTLYAHRCSYCIYSCLPEDGPKKFETCRRQLKLKLHINLETCAFRWFALHNYITMHGAKKRRIYRNVNVSLFCMSERLGLSQ